MHARNNIEGLVISQYTEGLNMAKLEKQYRLPEVSELTGYSVHSLRKKIVKKQLGFRKTGRIITIPESEIGKILGEFSPAVELTTTQEA